QVAPGGVSFSKLVFKIMSASRFKQTQRAIGARVLLTRRARVTATLLSPQRLRLSTWGSTLRAGRSIVRLRVPRQIRRPGLYSIRWVAQSGTDRVTRTVRVRLFVGKDAVKPVRVVLAGSAVPPRLPLGKGVPQLRVLSTEAADSAFDLAGAGSDGVEVMIVDVDQFGVGFVRDLHTVFPRLKIVA